MSQYNFVRHEHATWPSSPFAANSASRFCKNLRRSCRLLFTVTLSCAWLEVQAAEKGTLNKSSAIPAQSVDLFTGMQSGDLEVKFIPKNDHEAQLLIKNNTKQPLSVQLPEAFVGVPVLAQLGGGRQTNNNTGNRNNAPQTVGGGGNSFGGAGGGFGGRGGGGFNVPPETTSKLKVPVVCLEHGKADPRSQIPYELRSAESYTKDANVIELLTMLGNGGLDQRAAQVAAWHFANGMSWDELAAKKIHHLGGRPDESYFSKAELQSAMRIGTEVQQRVKDRPASDHANESPDPYSASDPSTGLQKRAASKLQSK